MPKRYIHFKLSKLVRDGLPRIYETLGHTAELRYLKGDELHTALRDKIIEEAMELPLPSSTSKNSELSELGDLLQALQDTMVARGFTMEDIEKARLAKYAEKGGFELGTYVEIVAIPEDDEKWIAYYRAHPDRFPEVDRT